MSEAHQDASRTAGDDENGRKVHQISLPAPFLGSVNTYLLVGDPLTLVDSGLGLAGDLEQLEARLEEAGTRIEDLEQILLTHHHLDHTGMAMRIRARSGARIVAVAQTAAWGTTYPQRARAERDFGEGMLAAHGATEQMVRAASPFWDFIDEHGSSFVTDRIVAPGEVIQAGDMALRVIFRPGHSTSDTLLVDDDGGVAFVGDHLLSHITPNTEPVPMDLPARRRRPALPEYLDGLRRTAALDLRRCHPGHGPEIADVRGLVADRLAFHDRRCVEVAALLGDGRPATAVDIAARFWDREVVETQTVLAVWEILGHLDLLVGRGLVEEANGGRQASFRLLR